MKLNLFIFIFVVVSGCKFKPSEQKKESSIEQKKETPIVKDLPFWSEFDTIVKVRVYKFIENKDCAGLQSEFNTAANNMDNHHKAGKKGGKFLELMDFLDLELKKAGCY